MRASAGNAAHRGCTPLHSGGVVHWVTDLHPSAACVVAKRAFLELARPPRALTPALDRTPGQVQYLYPRPGHAQCIILAPDETCHSADIPSPSLLKHLLKVEGGAAE